MLNLVFLQLFSIPASEVDRLVKLSTIFLEVKGAG